MVPKDRIRGGNDLPLNDEGRYVLYWMTASRRTGWNFALQRATEWARELDKPLVVLETLRCDYPWASDRLHRFLLEGMSHNRQVLAHSPVLYHPYVETEKGASAGLLTALAENACQVVSDDLPAFFRPHTVAAAAAAGISVRLERVDGNGLLPLHAADRAYPTAYAFRRFLQKTLPGHLMDFPASAPLKGLRLPPIKALPAEILRRWPAPEEKLLQGCRSELRRLPIDHRQAPVATSGGAAHAVRTLRRFLDERLAAYAEHRNEPQRQVTSGLSPYLHCGHISPHQVFAELTEREGWSVGDLSPETRGKRSGWWGVGASAEAFLDQLVTWRELGYNMCAFRNDYDRYDSLPGWARTTLEEHEDDPRPVLYELEEFEQAATGDPLWNAAQRQLRREGIIHNYLRMLWGKKILEWSRSPRRALEIMIELNDRYALDGRDPNSYSGIFWCLGRYDRAWGPQRPIFGKIRYMSSENTARKFRVDDYLQRYGPPGD